MIQLEHILLIFPIIVTIIWFVTFSFSINSLKDPKILITILMGFAFITFLSGVALYGNLKNLYILVYPWAFITTISLFPLLYLYILAIIDPREFNYKKIIHFIPAIIWGLSAIIFFIFLLNSNEREIYLSEILLNKEFDLKNYTLKFSILKYIDKSAKALYILLSIVYYIKTYLVVKKHQKVVEDYFSSLKDVSLSWFNTLFIFFILALISGVLVHFLPRQTVFESQYLSSIPFFFLGLFFAILGNYTSKQKVNIFSSKLLIYDQVEDLKSAKTHSKIEELDNKSIEIDIKLKERLEEYFIKDEPYLNPELRIWDVVKDINTNRTYLSKLINQHYGVRFSTFINNYRIEKAKQLMQEKNNVTLDTISILSGFHNYTSFFRAFKTYEKITPTEYIKKINRQ